MDLEASDSLKSVVISGLARLLIWVSVYPRDV